MRILPRPLGVLLSDAMGSLGRTWKVLVPIAIAVLIPASLATLAAFSIPGAFEFVEDVLENPEALANLSAEEFSERSRPFVVAGGLSTLVQALAMIFVFVCCHRVTIADVKNEPVDRRETLRHALSSYPSAALAGILGLAAAAGLFFLGFSFWSVPAMVAGVPNTGSAMVALVLLFALTAPGLWLGTSLSMVTSTSSVERNGVFGAMKRSSALVKGRWWATFGFLLMVAFLGSISLWMVQLVAIPVTAVGGGGNAPLALLLGVVFQGPIISAMGVTFTAWYIDLRSRKEPLLIDQL